MASNGLSNSRWLTSLVPAVASQHKCSRPIINAKPLVLIMEPDICFAQKKTDTESIPTIPVAVSQDDILISSLLKDIDALTISFNPENISHRCNKANSTSIQSTYNRLISNISPSSSALNLDHKTLHHSQHKTRHKNHYGPIHFHPRPHKQVHNHDHLSNLSPITPEKLKYAVPKPHPHHLPQVISVTNVDAHLRPSTPEPISPTDLWHTLKCFYEDPFWRADTEYRERNNPFPFLDLNEGWNRARCDTWMWHKEYTAYDDDGNLAGAEEEMLIKQSFARFSLQAQREAMEFDEDLLGEGGWANVFDVVFKGEGLGMCWARTPGSWGGPKHGLLTCCRGVKFYEEVDEWVYEVRVLVREWRKRNEGWEKMQKARKRTKRKWKYQRMEWREDGDKERLKRAWVGWREYDKISQENIEPRMIKTKFRGGEPMKVISEKQRARRGEQERKAGRWLDGTVRQGRMWAEFHWVFNYDSLWDIRNIVWPRPYVPNVWNSFFQEQC